MKAGDTGYYRKKGMTKQEQIAAIGTDMMIWLQLRETAGLEGLSHKIAQMEDIPDKEGEVKVTKVMGKIATFEWMDGSGMIGQDVTDRIELAAV